MTGPPGQAFDGLWRRRHRAAQKNRACGEKDYFTISQNPVAVCKPFFYIARYDINLK
jgi:hypothetical protein